MKTIIAKCNFTDNELLSEFMFELQEVNKIDCGAIIIEPCSQKENVIFFSSHSEYIYHNNLLSHLNDKYHDLILKELKEYGYKLELIDNNNDYYNKVLKE